MAMIAATLTFIAIFCTIAMRANTSLQHAERLPMQWGLNGRPTWFAPRPIALAFSPALGIGLLSFLIVMARTMTPRAGQEHLIFPTLVGIGMLFVGVQLLHIWLARRTLRGKHH